MEDLALARYRDLQVPRYTSYPPSPAFHPGIHSAIYRRWLAEVPGDAAGSLYLHVPFCRSMCWYCGCHTTITSTNAPILDYLDVLRREVVAVADTLPHRLQVVHVHFGGGTPTILEPADFTALLDLLRSRFGIGPDAEIAVEIDPRRLTRQMAAALGRAGVTRASLGVQTFDPKVQAAINRVQSFEQTGAVVDGLRAAGVRGVNLDLIYGLPHQTVASCVETVRRCLELRPERLAVFGYAHVPSFKAHQKRIDAAALPNGQERHAQAEAIAGTLEAAGYVRIGLDHFALPGDGLTRAQAAGKLHRNFQGYTTDPADVLLGFGASAIGRLPQGYVQNAVVLGSYRKSVMDGGLAVSKGYALTQDDRVRAEVIERLMCNFAVDLAPICARYGMTAADLLAGADSLPEMVQDGLAELSGTVLTISSQARPLVRAVAAQFDAFKGSGRPQARAV